MWVWILQAIGRDQARNLIGPIEQVSKSSASTNPALSICCVWNLKEWMMQEAMNKEKEERAVAEKLRLASF